MLLEVENIEVGLTYRSVYGYNKLSVQMYDVENSAGNIVDDEAVKLYTHMDRLGTTRFATGSPTNKGQTESDFAEQNSEGGNDKIMSWNDYNVGVMLRIMTLRVPLVRRAL